MENVQETKAPAVTSVMPTQAETTSQPTPTTIIATDAPSVTKAPDKEHTITVKEPAGASVYVNGIYQGVAPITFTKVLGNATITLAKDGYLTRSYSVNVLDDDKDVNYNFAALIAE